MPPLPQERRVPTKHLQLPQRAHDRHGVLPFGGELTSLVNHRNETPGTTNKRKRKRHNSPSPSRNAGFTFNDETLRQ